MANENDWLVTASEVGAEITQTTVAIDALDAVFATCTNFSAAQKTGWASFKTQYDTFIDGVNATFFGGISFAWQSNILSQVRGWQNTVAQWQAIAKEQCGYVGPGPYVNTPPPLTDSILWEVLKWGGIAAVGAGVFLAIAPYVEGAIASKAAGAVASRAKAGIAATKRLAQKARQKKSSSSDPYDCYG